MTSIIRIKKKERNFLIVDKGYLLNPQLSLKAKGLLTLLLSFPDNWEINVNDLIKRSKDGRDAVYSGLKELTEAGHVSREIQRDPEGRISKFIYRVYEIAEPVETSKQESGNEEDPSDEGHSNDPNDLSGEKLLSENPSVERLLSENPVLGNRKQLNNKLTKDIKNKIITAAKDNVSHPGPIQREPLSNSFAAANSSLPEQTLGPSLIKNQRDYIQQKIATDKQLCTTPEQDKTLCQAFETALLDPLCFTQAGYDFFKKFNTLKKAFIRGQWVVNFAKPSKRACFSFENYQIEKLEHQIQAFSREFHSCLEAVDPHDTFSLNYYRVAGASEHLEAITGLIQKMAYYACDVPTLERWQSQLEEMTHQLSEYCSGYDVMGIEQGFQKWASQLDKNKIDTLIDPRNRHSELFCKIDLKNYFLENVWIPQTAQEVNSGSYAVYG